MNRTGPPGGRLDACGQRNRHSWKEPMRHDLDGKRTCRDTCRIQDRGADGHRVGITPAHLRLRPAPVQVLGSVPGRGRHPGGTTMGWWRRSAPDLTVRRAIGWYPVQRVLRNVFHVRQGLHSSARRRRCTSRAVGSAVNHPEPGSRTRHRTPGDAFAGQPLRSPHGAAYPFLQRKQRSAGRDRARSEAAQPKTTSHLGLWCEYV